MCVPHTDQTHFQKLEFVSFQLIIHASRTSSYCVISFSIWVRQIGENYPKQVDAKGLFMKITSFHSFHWKWMNKREASSLTMCQTHYIGGFFEAFSSLRWTFACVSEWKAFLNNICPVFVMSSTHPVMQKWEINAFFFCRKPFWASEERIGFFFFLQKSRHQPKEAVTLQQSPKSIFQQRWKPGRVRYWITTYF